MEYQELLPKKPQFIALSFSGGGFRAATYCLGCLSYLDSKRFAGRKLTDRINFISSASGGSITNISYTAAQRRGEPFAVYYKRMVNALANSGLVDRVFEIMADPACWAARSGKARNLINAFSIAYDELLQQETFATYLKPVEGSVPEICINTTEFDNGMLFRFQNVANAGNKFLYFNNISVLAEIKLGDILACSSCFPVGFEPFMFPADFSYVGLKQEDLQQAIVQNYRFSPVKDDTQKVQTSFGLMDGGIDDNQGIGSFMLAEERMQNKNNFGYDLYLACDVSSNYTSGYDFPEENKRSLFTKPSLLLYALIICVVFLSSLLLSLMNVLPALFLFLCGASATLMVGFIALLVTGYRAYRRSKQQNNTFGNILFGNIFLFLNLRLSTLLQMIAARATSAAYLASVVFLKKIRR